MSNKPQISFVVTVHGDSCSEGRLPARLEVFSDGLSQLCSRHNLSAELIVVCWNSIAKGNEQLQKIQQNIYHPLEVRMIMVSPEIHRQFRNSDTIPFFEMIAKNAGIRRARAPYVLATDLNAVFSEELIAFLAKGRLNPKRVYTLHCHGVNSDIPEAAIDERLKWCLTHSVPSCPENLGDLNSGLVNKLREGSNAQRDRYDFFRHFPWLTLEGAKQQAKRLIKQQIRRPLSKPNPYVHSNVCRNFVMMSKDAWEKIRGYVELPIYPLYLDQLLVYMAVSFGLKQSVPRRAIRLYHINQDTIALDLPIEQRISIFWNMPWLDIAVWADLKEYYVSGGPPISFNSEDWGLASQTLPELTIS